MASAAFDFEVITPEGSAFKGRVTSVRLPGKDGSFGVLARHAPLVGALVPGPLIVEGEDGKSSVFATGEGFVEVSREKDARDGKDGSSVRALVDFCEPKEEIDVARARKAKARAQERLKSRDSKVDPARAEASLRRAAARLTVANFTLAS